MTHKSWLQLCTSSLVELPQHCFNIPSDRSVIISKTTLFQYCLIYIVFKADPDTLLNLDSLKLGNLNESDNIGFNLPSAATFFQSYSIGP